MRIENRISFMFYIIYPLFQDKHSLHRLKADEGYLVGKGLPPVAAYLTIDQIIDTALQVSLFCSRDSRNWVGKNPEKVDIFSITWMRFTQDMASSPSERISHEHVTMQESRSSVQAQMSWHVWATRYVGQIVP